MQEYIRTELWLIKSLNTLGTCTDAVFLAIFVYVS